MSYEYSKRIGYSISEEKFIDILCDTYGPENGQYVYVQYPFVDIYGRHRSIDYALKTIDGRIAIEVDGTTWHQPDKISESKYHDDLLKQNSMVHLGWKVFRWTSIQIKKYPERIKDELLTFLGGTPLFQYLDDFLPEQKGHTLSLMDHQREALENLKQLRKDNSSIALLYHATGSGKTVTAVSDSKSIGERTLFVAHTKEIVFQAYKQFVRLWPEVSIGRFVEGYRERDAYVVCGTIQSITQNLTLFKPDEFGYIVVDECHHGTAETYQKLLAYFMPKFTLGLTATPERADGENLLSIFKNVAHKLDLRTAVENGTLVPVRCIRVKTNIDMHDVRINGFQYNTLDLNTKILVPSRNKLIVDTWLEYANQKATVVYCTSVQHADEIAALFQDRGIDARSVSGSTKAMERKEILLAYERGDIPVLCACDLLNEGWDSPHTEVLFMARPTMSKTIYMQQLGRGMRTRNGKTCLFVFDFVDNAGMFNMPYSIHRLLNLSGYRPGAMVLGKKKDLEWEEYIFAKGEKPDVLVDYPFSVADYEVIDLFNWHEKASKMVSQIEFVRQISTQSETIERYIRDGKIVADLEVPISDKRTFRFFEPDRIAQYAKEYGWQIINNENKKNMFMKMIQTMTVSYSYKPVFIKGFLDHMDEKGNVRLEDIVQYFADFYETRIRNGLLPERRPCIFTKGNYSDKDVEQLILRMPFKRFEDMGFIRHSKYLGVIQLDHYIISRLTSDDIKSIRNRCDEKLDEYFSDII